MATAAERDGVLLFMLFQQQVLSVMAVMGPFAFNLLFRRP
jgi:hypothetical protein